jgi:hypothetical protein
MTPMPGECSLFYRDDADMLRSWLRAGRTDPMIYAVPPIEKAWRRDGSEDMFGPEPKRIVLAVKHCAGPAPYVGRPFAYLWPVVVDDLGRYVAGDATIEFTTPDFGEDWDLYETHLMLSGR